MSRHLLETFIVLLMMMMVAWFAAPINGANHFATVTKPRLSEFEHPIKVVLPCRTVAVKQRIPINDKRCPEISSIKVNNKRCVGHCMRPIWCILPKHLEKNFKRKDDCGPCEPSETKKMTVGVLCGGKKIYRRVQMVTGCKCNRDVKYC